MENLQYLSLYDYLGYAAGGELGNKVYNYAKTHNIYVMSKEISNKKYVGRVLMYPKNFLNEYFKTSIKQSQTPEYSGNHSETDFPY